MRDLCLSGYLIREPVWTEAAAVGSREWVERLSQRVLVGRKSVVLMESRPDVGVGENETSYALRLSRRQADTMLQAAATQRR